jgi:hypothetical protein
MVSLAGVDRRRTAPQALQNHPQLLRVLASPSRRRALAALLGVAVVLLSCLQAVAAGPVTANDWDGDGIANRQVLLFALPPPPRAPPSSHGCSRARIFHAQAQVHNIVPNCQCSCCQ